MSTIEDERIERMRTHVMSAVDAEVRGRSRRIRRGAAGVVAAAFVVVVAGAVVPQLGSTSSDDSASSAASDQAVEQPAPEIGGEIGDDAGGSVAPDDSARLQKDRDVITTGSAHVVAKDPHQASADLAAWVEARQKGRVDAREVSGTDQDAYASVTVRVPSDQVSATIDHLDAYGTVDSVSVGNDDVTSTVRDLDARISALRVSIDRLEKIVADSANSDELVRAEQALTDRQSQLEQLLTEQASLGDQVDLATLQVDFSAGAAVDDVDPGGFTGGLVSGWNALVGTLNGLVTALGAVLPFLGVLLVLWVGYRVVRRVRGQRWS